MVIKGICLVVLILIFSQKTYANEVNPLISSYREVTYTGSIDGKYNITMSLRIDDNVSLRGTYKYDRNGISIPLKGTINKNYCKIDEFAQKKKSKDKINREPTAYFEGKFDPTYSILAGKWNSIDGKSYPFSLRLQQSCAKKPSKNQKNFRTSLSFLEEIKLQDTTKSKLRTLLTRQITDDTREVSVEYVSENLVSVLYTEEQEGGAHSYTAYNSYNISIDGDKLTELYYLDLFTKESNYLTKLSDYCLKVLRQQDRLIDSNRNTIDYGDLANFTISSKGIIIYFTPLNVVKISEDDGYSFLIPYKELENIIDRKGPLSVFLNSTGSK